MKLNKSGHSDALIVIILAGIIGSVFITGTYIWGEFNATNNYTPPKTTTPSNDNQYEMVSKYEGRVPNCYYGNCLFKNNFSNQDYVFGLGELEGFFTIKRKMDMGDVELDCDSLVITDGSPELIQSYLDLINSGNHMNSLDESNRPVVNINLNDISEELKNKIINSNPDNTIRLTIFNYPPVGKGGSVCYNAIKIIEETPINNEALSCDEIIKKAREITSSMNYCEVHSECFIVKDYPLACYYLMNKNADQTNIKKIIKEYSDAGCPDIMFDCYNSILTTSCYNNKCEING